MSDPFMQAALAEARQGLAEGGIPIGSALVREGKSWLSVATGGCNRTTRSRMPRSIVCGAPAGSAVFERSFLSDSINFSVGYSVISRIEISPS